LRQLRRWSIQKTAEHFGRHRNTIRAWIRAAEGKGRPSLLNGAVVWNGIDEAVRWAAHELRRLCPEPEFGTRSLARQVLRASIQISRSTVQRVL
jgi:transposase